MKGFIYLIEVAIAGVIIILVIPTFFTAQIIKHSWERADLIATANDIIDSLKTSGVLEKILNDSDTINKINRIKPPNIKYSLKIIGAPKQNILVGCNCTNDQLTSAKEFLTPVYVNNRWINFIVNQTDLENINNFDALIFINYTNFDENLTIQNYIKTGKPVVAVTDITDITFDQLNDTFNLSAGYGSGALNFTKFAPEENKIAKYFLGFGFDVATPNIIDGKKTGKWWIWKVDREVNITSDMRVEVKNLTSEEGIINVKEGESFLLRQPIIGNFSVKKIWSDRSGVIFQALNTSFIFEDFIDHTNEKEVTGNNIVSNPDNTFAAMTINGTSIWISNFPQSDEYKTLVKAAIAQPQEWYLVENIPERKFIDVSTFVNLCCDMPESIGLEFMLWYMY